MSNEPMTEGGYSPTAKCKTNPKEDTMYITNRVSNVSKFFSAIAVAVAILVTSAGRAASADDSTRVDKTSYKSFSETVKAVEKAVKSEGMMVVAKIDHRNMLSMVGAKIKGAMTVEFGKPEMGKMLLPMNPAIGLEMPGKIYVFETADGVIVSFRKVALQYASYGDPEIRKAGEMMDMMADKITTTATQ